MGWDVIARGLRHYGHGWHRAQTKSSLTTWGLEHGDLRHIVGHA
jgi:hypothetical protein